MFINILYQLIYFINKKHPPQKQKKLRPNNLSNYSGANHSLFSVHLSAPSPAAALRQFLLLDFSNIETGKAILDFIAYTAELRIDKLRRTHRVRRIVETDVKTLPYPAAECRTTLVGTAADSDYIVPLLVQIRVDVRRNMAADVDAHFLHHLYRLGIYLCSRLGTTRKHFNRRVERLQKAVCHLAAATVSCAKYQYSHTVLNCFFTFKESC